MMISARVPTVIPATEIPEMILIILKDFLDTRYLLAIYNGSFKDRRVG
jgi:hypothetical protein